jgi:hypothetical protein
MTVPVLVTVTVTLRRDDPSGRVDVYGDLTTYVVQGGGRDMDPPDARAANAARAIFMASAQKLRESMDNAAKKK